MARIELAPQFASCLQGLEQYSHVLVLSRIGSLLDARGNFPQGNHTPLRKFGGAQGWNASPPLTVTTQPGWVADGMVAVC